MAHVRTWTVDINISEHEDERRTGSGIGCRGQVDRREVPRGGV
ncbi:hypothetical protein [Actinoplanes sp. NPDC026623]